MNQPSAQPLVSVVIPTRNRLAELKRCLRSVQESSYQKVEVIVVDDASDEPVEPSLAKTFPKARFLRNERRLYLSCSRNYGAEASEGRYLFFLDDDNVLDRDAVAALVRPLELARQAAASSPVVYYAARPNEVWTSYVAKGRFPGFYKLHTEVPKKPTRTFAFHNSFMVRKSVFTRLGGFDCMNFPVRFSELDFAHKLHVNGYYSIVTPEAKVWHDIGWAGGHIDSERAYYTERNRIILLKRYFPKDQLRFYECCILPFLGSYYLLTHGLSSPDGMIRTSASLLRGIVDGLRLKAERVGNLRQSL